MSYRYRENLREATVNLYKKFNRKSMEEFTIAMIEYISYKKSLGKNDDKK